MTTPPAAWQTARNLVLARELWDGGLSLREIGRRLGTTKNAIAGYAHRQGWPPRPSVLPADFVRSPSTHPKKARVRPRATWDATPLREACRPLALAVATPSFGGCQWPTTSARPWAFCGQPTIRGTAWCAPHFARCYHRLPRRELVA